MPLDTPPEELAEVIHELFQAFQGVNQQLKSGLSEYFNSKFAPVIPALHPLAIYAATSETEQLGVAVSVLERLSPNNFKELGECVGYENGPLAKFLDSLWRVAELTGVDYAEGDRPKPEVNPTFRDSSKLIEQQLFGQDKHPTPSEALNGPAEGVTASRRPGVASESKVNQTPFPSVGHGIV